MHACTHTHTHAHTCRRTPHHTHTDTHPTCISTASSTLPCRQPPLRSSEALISTGRYPQCTAHTCASVVLPSPATKAGAAARASQRPAMVLFPRYSCHGTVYHGTVSTARHGRGVAGGLAGRRFLAMACWCPPTATATCTCRRTHSCSPQAAPHTWRAGDEDDLMLGSPQRVGGAPAAPLPRLLLAGAAVRGEAGGEAVAALLRTLGRRRGAKHARVPALEPAHHLPAAPRGRASRRPGRQPGGEQRYAGAAAAQGRAATHARAAGRSSATALPHAAATLLQERPASAPVPQPGGPLLPPPRTC